MSWVPYALLVGAVLIAGLLVLGVVVLHALASRSRRVDVERELYGGGHARLRLLDRDDFGFTDWQE